VGEAATAAAAAAAAAVAPASLRCPSAITLGVGTGAAAAAAAELADASAKAAVQQQQQKAAQQQQHRSSLRHQLQLQALVGEVGSPGLQSPQSPGTNRSSTSWLADPDAAAGSLQHCSSQVQQQQQLLGPRANSPPASQSGSSTSRQSPLRRAVHQDSLAPAAQGASGVVIDAAGASRDSRCGSAARASLGGLAVLTDMKSFSQHSSRPTQLSSPSRSSLSSASGAATGSPAAASAAGAEQLQSQEQQQAGRSSMVSARGSSTSRQRQSRCSSPTALSKTGFAEVPPASPKTSTLPAGAAAGGTATHTPRSPRAAAAAAAGTSGPNSSRDRSPSAAPGCSRLKSGISRPSEPPSPQPAATEQRCGSPKHSFMLPSQEQHSISAADDSQAPGSAAPAAADTAVAVVQQLKQPQELSSLYGLALSASVCMADLVRQVRLMWLARVVLALLMTCYIWGSCICYAGVL
jgi:hypothetical protein